MQILLLNYEFPPIGGGASQATFFMAKELVRQGHKVDVLTSRTREQPAFETIEGIRVYRALSWRRGIHQFDLTGAARFLVSAFFELRKLVHRNDYDLAHFFFALPTGALAFYWKQRTRKPYVVSLRGSDVPGYDSTDGKLGVLHAILRPVTRRILHGAEHVVANSRSLRQLALKSFPDIEISVITNAVSCTAFKPDLGRSSTGNVVRALSVARLIPRKGLETMIKALAQERTERVELDIVGDGALAGDLVKLAADLGVKERLHFHGALRDAELLRAYQQADFFILPSLSESFSMSLLEAMACGLPVVASNVGGIPELVVDAQNGILVRPGDSKAFAEAITMMAQSEERRHTFAANNRAKIRRRYTWEQITTEYLNQCYRWSPTELQHRAPQPTL